MAPKQVSMDTEREYDNNILVTPQNERKWQSDMPVALWDDFK
jgi:hypothetical protein